MKLIEALKQTKNLLKKLDDLKAKVSVYCAYPSYESPVYPDQKAQVSEWIQSYEDVLKEILRLRTAIQKTNLQIEVEIEIGGKKIKKKIAEWIHRRRDLAKLNLLIWGCLSDRGLREGKIQRSTGESEETKIIRCYDPKQKDNKMEIYNSEPSLIDQKLEIINAITEVIF